MKGQLNFMALKHFLKIDKKKFVVFTILFIIFLFMPIWPVIDCSVLKCLPGVRLSLFFDSLESLNNKQFYDFGYLNFLVSMLLGSIALCYLLSSIIIRIYNAFRKIK